MHSVEIELDLPTDNIPPSSSIHAPRMRLRICSRSEYLRAVDHTSIFQLQSGRPLKPVRSITIALQSWKLTLLLWWLRAKQYGMQESLYTGGLSRW